MATNLGHDTWNKVEVLIFAMKKCQYSYHIFSLKFHKMQSSDNKVSFIRQPQYILKNKIHCGQLNLVV